MAETGWMSYYSGQFRFQGLNRMHMYKTRKLGPPPPAAPKIHGCREPSSSPMSNAAIIIFVVVLLDLIGGKIGCTIQQKNHERAILRQEAKTEYDNAGAECGILEKKYEWAEWLHERAVKEGNSSEKQNTREDMDRIKPELGAARLRFEKAKERYEAIEPTGNKSGVK